MSMTQTRLHLRIVNMTSLPDGGPLEAWVAPGQILEAGRDSGLDWCLPDPQRLISSRHFEIRPEKGGWVLVDLSTNGTFLNGAATRVKSPCPLHSGDRLQVGQYSIEITEERGTQPPAPHPGPGQGPGQGGVPGGLPGVGPGGGPGVVPGGLSGAVPETAPAPQPPPRPAARSLPGGLDPWAVQVAPAAGQATDPGAAQASGPGASAFTASAPPATRPPADIWASAAPDTPAPHSATPPVPGPIPAAPPPGGGPAFPQPAFPQPAFPQPASPQPGLAPQAPHDPVPDPSAPHGPASDPGALLQIIESAAGLAAGTLSRGDPAQVAREIGETLRALTEDLAGLLQARAVARRSVKAKQVTMIGREDNNPLKFMPTPDQALTVMFGPPRPGFQRGPQAVRAGFADIRSHQYAIHAALQPALAQLLEDLAPEAIEKRLEGVRLNRKARAWELFVERWDAKTHAHDNGMLDVFLALFADAYDRESGRG